MPINPHRSHVCMRARLQSLSTAFLALIAVVGCDDRPDQWDAFVYAGDDLIGHETIRGFKTFELCQVAAIDRLRAERPDGGGDYECGYKCGPSTEFGGINVCEETRK